MSYLKKVVSLPRGICSSIKICERQILSYLRVLNLSWWEKCTGMFLVDDTIGQHLSLGYHVTAVTSVSLPTNQECREYGSPGRSFPIRLEQHWTNRAKSLRLSNILPMRKNYKLETCGDNTKSNHKHDLLHTRNFWLKLPILLLSQ